MIRGEYSNNATFSPRYYGDDGANENPSVFLESTGLDSDLVVNEIQTGLSAINENRMALGLNQRLI